MQHLDDTIAAIATSHGQGAIGIIRISGKKTFEIMDSIFIPFKKKERKTHQLIYGIIHKGAQKCSLAPNFSLSGKHFCTPAVCSILDHVLVSYMFKKNSYSGEDMAEVHAHGGVFVLSEILNLIISKGARRAEPGEFTFRAFMNGKIDLSQAEAVIDVIQAKSQTALQLAQQKLEGKFSKEIIQIKENIIEVLAHTEAAIDFSTEDIDVFSIKIMNEKIEIVFQKIKTIAGTYHQGKLLSEGVGIAIVGRPNVGKSSLFNALLNMNRAIVTEEAGTTRDTIEETIHYRGVLFHFIDTAGIREATNKVEKIGIEQSFEKINTADIILMVLDGSEELTQEDEALLDALDRKNIIIVINKLDLIQKVFTEESSVDAVQGFGLGAPVACHPRRWTISSLGNVHKISALKKTGIDQLLETIYSKTIVGKINSEDVFITKERHRDALNKALIYLKNYQDGLSENKSLEFLALDLRSALDELEQIIGRVSQEDIYDKIFSSFCIGK